MSLARYPLDLSSLLYGEDNEIGHLTITKAVVHHFPTITCTPFLRCVRSVHELFLRDTHGLCHFRKTDREAGQVEKLEHGIVTLQNDSSRKGHVTCLMTERFQIEAQAIPRTNHELLLLHLVEILK